MKDVTMNAHLPNYLWDGGGHVLIFYSKLWITTIVTQVDRCCLDLTFLLDINVNHLNAHVEIGTLLCVCVCVCACARVFFSFDLREASLALLRIRTKIPP
jgi:hypothetical protein